MTKVEQKLSLINQLLGLIVNYKPVYSEEKERERLYHFKEVICEELQYVVEARLRGEK